jgi:hypothetical protein
MTNRTQAWGMWALAVLLLAALALNLQLRAAGETYRPLHIWLCGPLALYCAVVGWMKWNAD